MKTLAFLDDPLLNRAWLHCPDRGMTIYVRKGDRMHPDTKEITRCFTIANVVVDPELRGQGNFTEYLAWLCPVIREMGYKFLYVENVLTRRFENYFNRRQESDGWIRVTGTPPSYYKELGDKHGD